MTIQGFLDFQEGTIWQSDVAFTNSSVPLANGATAVYPSSGTYVCSNWQATQFRCSTTGGIGDFTAQWFTDAAAANQIGERRWSIYDGWPLNTYLTLGNLGPYLRVQVSNFTGGNINTFVRGIFTNRPLGPFQAGYAGPMIHAIGQNVAGGATVRVRADYLYAGPAYLWLFNQVTAAWGITLYALESSGTATPIYQTVAAEAATADRRQSLVLPPRPIVVDLANTSGVAQNFWATLIADVFR